MKEHFEDGFDAVIFDMDGTLLDSMSYWRRINFDYPRLHGFEPPEEIRDRLMLTHNAIAAAYYIETFHLPYTKEEVLNEYRAIMRGYYETSVMPKPHAVRYLEHLKARGKRMCVGTATPLELCVPALERHGLTKYMEFVVSAKSEGMDKADPAFYEMLARRLGVPTRRCVMFEDALYAMEGAKQAGMQVMGIEEPLQQANREKIMAICDVYVRSFEELCV